MTNYEDPYQDEEKTNQCKWCYAECENDFCSSECALKWVQE